MFTHPVKISIRAPLAGSDMPYPVWRRRNSKFQSALPLRGATQQRVPRPAVPNISIRAPLAGSDPYRVHRAPGYSNFNPRSPCGERHAYLGIQAICYLISIRAPLAGSDPPYPSGCVDMLIFQSALPLRGATCRKSYMEPSAGLDFNPRSPCGERRMRRRYRKPIQDFNPRSPCGERPSRCSHHGWRRYFNPRSPCGERPWYREAMRHRHDFNPRSPCGERPLHFVASIYYQQSVVFSKTVAANSVDKLRKTTAKSAITGCEPPS